ncbi:MAG TPA: helix-turn-helix transcriptional regulator [Oscillospiraceae bacterium]|nr:helix-turn-helix transcriptional regulator [Oscillospiraceae bacterium]HPF54922.1 helix-turn-helix transcriptional regulator [Clostridiales bacterium]HPK34981.1 helix-turn-helix transcriptional regulator [Oscillospiraceae bacterium]HPR75539.1 helix-turn-helix transcriptional regulator [Oscillospiraceae bacterium]
MELSEKILRLMNEQGYSYESLEKATGISRSTLQRKISASPNKLKLSEIERIAAAFGESAQELLEWRKKEDETCCQGLSKEINSLSIAEVAKVREYIRFLKWNREF